MAVRYRTHGLGAAHEQGRGTRAMASLTGALLLINFLLGAIDLGAGEHLVLARTALGQLPHHHALDQVGAGLKSEDGVVEFDVAGGLVVEMEDLGFHISPHSSALRQPELQRQTAASSRTQAWADAI